MGSECRSVGSEWAFACLAFQDPRRPLSPPEPIAAHDLFFLPHVRLSFSSTTNRRRRVRVCWGRRMAVGTPALHNTRSKQAMRLSIDRCRSLELTGTSGLFGWPAPPAPSTANPRARPPLLTHRRTHIQPPIYQTGTKEEEDRRLPALPPLVTNNPATSPSQPADGLQPPASQPARPQGCGKGGAARRLRPPRLARI